MLVWRRRALGIWVILLCKAGGGSAIPVLLPVLISDVGLESQGVGDLGEFFVQGRGGDSEAVNIGSVFVSMVRPFAEGSIAREEFGLPLFVVAPTSEDFIAIDASDGSSQMPAPDFSIPFAEEFFGFFPVGSLSKDWEDFYSSLPSDCEGMSDSELLAEAFALPWEVDVLVRPSRRNKEVSSSRAEINQVVRPSTPAKSLIRRGFLGPRAVSPPPPPRWC